MGPVWHPIRFQEGGGERPKKQLLSPQDGSILRAVSRQTSRFPVPWCSASPSGISATELKSNLMKRFSKYNLFLNIFIVILRIICLFHCHSVTSMQNFPDYVM